MQSETTLIAFGSLRPVLGSGNIGRLRLDRPTALVDIFHRLRIPPDRVQMVMVNHKAAQADCSVRPGDRIALFPPEYPIFADWKDYRRTRG